MNNYNYYQQQPIQQQRLIQAQQSTVALKGRPVSSLDEVRATAIDFDGSIFYFTSLANDKIYTKQINMDGTSTVRVYELGELPIGEPAPAQSLDNLVTKDEFKQTISSLLEQISALKSNQQTQELPQTSSSPQKEYSF